MEIYYCNTCGTKIDSDAFASGDAVRAGSDQVYCKACAPKTTHATPVAIHPNEKHAHERHPSRHPSKPHERAHPKNTAPAPVSPRTFAILVLGLGVLILIFGAVSAFKGHPEPNAPLDNQAAKNIPDAAPQQSPVPAPTIETPTVKLADRKPPKIVGDPEKAAAEAFAAIAKGAETRPVKEQVVLLENFLADFPDTSLSARARIEFARTKSLQKAMVDGFVSIATVETKDEDWGFHPGSEFPGATGSMERDDRSPKEGKYSLRLSGDFSGGGSYVSAGRKLNGALGEVLAVVPNSRIAGLRLWVRSPVAHNITLRANDSSEQCHQQDLGFQAKPEWQMLEFKTLNSGTKYSHWGGANDGTFHGTLRAINFLIGREGVAPAKSAEIWIDQVELVLK